MNKKNKIFERIIDFTFLLAKILIVLFIFSVFLISCISSIKNVNKYEVGNNEESNLENFDDMSHEVLSVCNSAESREPKIDEAIAVEAGHTEIEEIKYPFNERYKDIEVTEYDIDLMAAVVHHESNNQCFAGQRMVAEVILNRVVQGDMGGATIRDVIYAKNQFFYVTDADIARANETNYQAVYAALNEMPITDEDVVYFALSPHNNSVFEKIGAHYFCRKW